MRAHFMFPDQIRNRRHPAMLIALDPPFGYDWSQRAQETAKHCEKQFPYLAEKHGGSIRWISGLLPPALSALK
jgi:hypothetical protein